MSSKPYATSQRGASLLEVLVTVLILSFGLLALGGMLSYGTQLPKLSGYRASATMIATAHIERMRANVDGFRSSQYVSTTEPHSYGVTNWEARGKTVCAYPNCNSDSIAVIDINETHFALRRELPGSSGAWPGLRVTCDGGCSSQNRPEGDIWIMWSEPNYQSLNANGSADGSDECPPGITLPSPTPRCLHVRFKL